MDTYHLRQLDYLYMPSRDVAGDLRSLAGIGGTVLFAIEGVGSRVAAVRMTEGPPLLLLADHLDGDRPIMVFRVRDLEAARASLESGGLRLDRTVEIPPGPCSTFVAPGGHRIAIYQPTRPDVVDHFEGRRDF